MPDPIDLDHVAIAAEKRADPWPLLGGVLGGRFFGLGETIGFGFSQIEFANAMRVECLYPNRVEENDFLRRFLDRNGPGPHHLTFKVPDIRALLDEARREGYEPVMEELSDPIWMEAFFHPKQTHGVVVQVAQAAPEDWEVIVPRSYPEPAGGFTATLARVVHGVADLERALEFFEGFLGGERVDTGAEGTNAWVELRWQGPGRLRLVRAAEGPLADWVGARPGRVHDLTLQVPDPFGVPGARPLDDERACIEPDPVLGTRLVLEPRP